MLSSLGTLVVSVLAFSASVLWYLSGSKGFKVALPSALNAFNHNQGTSTRQSAISKSAASTQPKKEETKAPLKKDTSELAEAKQLYYQLHNIEQFPDILPAARSQLLSLFSETLSKACQNPSENILGVKHYSHESLAKFMKDHDDKVCAVWEDYCTRRKNGGPRELFKDADEAAWYLKQIAPVKYVDGAWLGYINRITLPFALRSSVKSSWQVLSEELGDGDLDKNHAHLFRELTQSIHLNLPNGDSEAFIDPGLEMNEIGVWKSALGQLLISLFPHEFFPEILGFNMHFEMVALDTLKASKELKEVKIDPYYFMLHLSIDNADSGHTAIAQQAVTLYIDGVLENEGEEAAHQAWKRVQAGFMLSENLPGGVICPSMKQQAVDKFPRSELEGEIVKIFEAKAAVGHKIHCPSQLKIGGRRLVDWLEPTKFATKEWQMDFMDAFVDTKGWIAKGDPNKSKFVKELIWGGRMFGAFTQTETDLVKKWISQLRVPDATFYWEFTGRSHDITSQNSSRINVDGIRLASNHQLLHKPAEKLTKTPDILPENAYRYRFGYGKKPNVTHFIPLWFAHPCLLESFVSIPFKTATPFACDIVKILRAQSGFGLDGAIVAGTDEANRTDTIGLVELGQEMLRNFGIPEAESLKDILNRFHCDFAVTMLQLSMRPFANKGLLIGMSMAFTALHADLASCEFLSEPSRDALTEIARRERTGLMSCFEQLNEYQHKETARGFWMVADKLTAYATES